jgi:predicted small secreted protein
MRSSLFVATFCVVVMGRRRRPNSSIYGNNPIATESLPRYCHWMKKYVLLLVLASAACVTLTTGCATMHGVGTDVEKAGDSIKDSADKHS